MGKIYWLVIGLVLMSLNVAHGATFKFYHCQSEEGSVVVQDRPCAVTRLATAKPGQIKQRPSKQLKTPQIATRSDHKRLDYSAAQRIQPVSVHTFTDLIDRHQWTSKITQNQHGWQLVVNIPGQTGSPSNQVSVEYFKNPEQTLAQEAFSYALNRYHKIRLNYPLVDSEFKSHPAYKVFNIIYRLSKQTAKSEFFVSKLDGSLWVFSSQCHPTDQAKTQRVMAQLQALI